MACGCMDAVQMKLHPRHKLKETFTITNIEGAEVIIAMPLLRIYQQANNKPEDRARQPHTFDITHCPWCGTRYIPEKSRSENA